MYIICWFFFWPKCNGISSLWFYYLIFSKACWSTHEFKETHPSNCALADKRLRRGFIWRLEHCFYIDNTKFIGKNYGSLALTVVVMDDFIIKHSTYNMCLIGVCCAYEHSNSHQRKPPNTQWPEHKCSFTVFIMTKTSGQKCQVACFCESVVACRIWLVKYACTMCVCSHNVLSSFI